ncbi:DUF7601 domain-containing protein [Ileibacterium valens]|uniref:DUF7601 domain-containing protein n=1 Tax=Ileibacterium valens TaxID=1862668 RepID=UPI003F73FA24
MTITADNTNDQFVLEIPNSTKQVLDANGSNTVTATVNLGQGQTFNVYGLSAGDTYKVEETDPEVLNGIYTPGISQTAGTGGTINVNNYEVTGQPANNDVAFTFTNTRTSNVPTAFFITYGPYLAGLALLGGLGHAMFGKKKNNC